MPRNDSEAIVVGAVGSAAPWFLRGWAEGTKVEFIIDARLQYWRRRCLTACVFPTLGCFPDCVHVDAGWSWRINPH